MSSHAGIIVSDAHLGAIPPENERAFHDFLRFAADSTDDLVVNGDLFDFWFEYRTVILGRYFGTLRILADMVDAGCRIRLVGGNHDSWGGPFLRDEIGIELVDGPQVTDIGGRRTFLAHGDGIGKGDYGYRALKTIVRSRIAARAFRHLHPDWSDALINRVSRTESRHGAPESGRTRSSALAAHARELLENDTSLQLVAFGHCHIPELTEIEPGRHYLNTGDWVYSCTWLPLVATACPRVAAAGARALSDDERDLGRPDRPLQWRSTRARTIHLAHGDPA